MNQKLIGIKREIDKTTNIVGDISTALLISRTSVYKVSKIELKNAIN